MAEKIRSRQLLHLVPGGEIERLEPSARDPVSKR
jgi:hypothetical protein